MSGPSLSRQIKISIHAPRAGSDLKRVAGLVTMNISIHAPRAGSDHKILIEPAYTYKFQSTLPVRGATIVNQFFICLLLISIHAPRAGSDMLQEMDPYVGLLISIHAPRAGSDKCSFGLTPSEFNFNPRSPCGERPNDGKIGTLANNFNPRSPCGERRFNASFMIFTARLFQSTLPVRGATM